MEVRFDTDELREKARDFKKGAGDFRDQVVDAAETGMEASRRARAEKARPLMFNAMGKRDAEIILGLSGTYTAQSLRKAYLLRVQEYSRYMLTDDYIHVFAERNVAELSDARMVLEKELATAGNEGLVCDDASSDPDLEPSLRELEEAYLDYARKQKGSPSPVSAGGFIGEETCRKVRRIVFVLMCAMFFLLLINLMFGGSEIFLVFFFVMTTALEVVEVFLRRYGDKRGYSWK